MIRAKTGFTFIELLVSITIAAVLASIGLASYSSTNKRSRDTRRKADIESIRSGLEIYRSEVGSYPALSTNGSGCLTATEISNLGTIYLKPIPDDPKDDGSTYCYKYTRTSTTTYTMSCNLESGDPCSYANP